MMIRMSKILEKYDLNVWIWYPEMFGDYTNQSNVERSLDDNKKIFSQLPKIDAVFVCGGDPGNLKPALLFAQLVGGLLQNLGMDGYVIPFLIASVGYFIALAIMHILIPKIKPLNL